MFMVLSTNYVVLKVQHDQVCNLGRFFCFVLCFIFALHIFGVPRSISSELNIVTTQITFFISTKQLFLRVCTL